MTELSESEKFKVRREAFEAQGKGCSSPECDSPAAYASRGLCHGCYKRGVYGECALCASTPANGKDGFCSHCRRRGGPPAFFQVGRKLNTATDKYCPKCKKVFPRDDFYKNRSTADGLAKHCGACARERASQSGPIERARVYQWFADNCEQTSRALCVRCGKPHGETWELDHITPYSHGGVDDLTNRQILCASCNSAKGNREAIDYRVWLSPPDWDCAPAATRKPRRLSAKKSQT